jgi:hypothetical protein
MKLHQQLLRAAVLAALGACAFQVSAQEQAPEAGPPAATAPAGPATPNASTSATAPIADAKVEKFADAYVAVQDIQAKAAQQIEATKDPDQAQKVRTDAETAMIKAVEQSGLQVDEFNQIAQAMASDLDLRSRVAAQVQERKKS